jgi:hypothetical protein
MCGASAVGWFTEDDQHRFGEGVHVSTLGATKEDLRDPLVRELMTILTAYGLVAAECDPITENSYGILMRRSDRDDTAVISWLEGGEVKLWIPPEEDPEPEGPAVVIIVEEEETVVLFDGGGGGGGVGTPQETYWADTVRVIENAGLDWTQTSDTDIEVTIHFDSTQPVGS